MLALGKLLVFDKHSSLFKNIVVVAQREKKIEFFHKFTTKPTV
jgi:hypothetical protein